MGPLGRDPRLAPSQIGCMSMRPAGGSRANRSCLATAIRCWIGWRQPVKAGRCRSRWPGSVPIAVSCWSGRLKSNSCARTGWTWPAWTLWSVTANTLSPSFYVGCNSCPVAKWLGWPSTGCCMADQNPNRLAPEAGLPNTAPVLPLRSRKAGPTRWKNWS
jgi:hypothetical protein